jgi:hypothetical protein
LKADAPAFGPTAADPTFGFFCRKGDCDWAMVLEILNNVSHHLFFDDNVNPT